MGRKRKKEIGRECIVVDFHGVFTVKMQECCGRMGLFSIYLYVQRSCIFQVTLFVL